LLRSWTAVRREAEIGSIFRTDREQSTYRSVMKVTGSLIVCVTAAAFTATVLLVNPDPTPAPAAAPGAPPTITISQFAFNPVMVPAGTTVTVNNLDGVEHTVTATDGSFDSGVLATGGAIGIVAPATPGVYSFFCAIHPSMSGQLTVQA
jgi:plastocyanin